MQTTTRDGVTLHYETEGDGETVVFVGSVGFGGWQWAWQQPALEGPYRTLVWDLRGSGKSDSSEGPYGVPALVADLEAVLAASDTRRAHLVGAGLGGTVALEYARRFGRARSLALLGTPPTGEAVDLDTLGRLYPERMEADALRRSLSVAFTETFRRKRPDLVDRICAWRRAEDARGDPIAAQIEALSEYDSGPLYEITLPTLVFNGIEDPVVSKAAGERLAAGLPRGEFEPVEGRRLCHIEHSVAVSDRLLGFLGDVSAD